LIEINDGGLNCWTSPAPSFYVVLYAGHRSAPRILAALAGVVHHRHRADGDEHNRDIALRSAGMFSVPLFHWFAVLRIEGCQTGLLGDINNRQACRSMPGTSFSLTADHVFAGKFTRRR
jgi:hypothetical protein